MIQTDVWFPGCFDDERGEQMVRRMIESVL
jgi:hypothetical protein